MNARPVVVEASDLERRYESPPSLFRQSSTVYALNGVSFTLEAGRTLAVVGESGCGKSTLARQITLIERPSGGTLKIGGTDVSTNDKAALRAARRKVQLVFQDPYGSLNPRKKVGTIIGEPLSINERLGRRAREERVRQIMARVGLRPEHYDRYPHMFSGGQRQRIAVARALTLQPQVVVADEPVSALDVSIQAQVLNLFMDLQDEFGLAYLFISHDLSVVEHIANQVMVMYLGRAVEHGDKRAIFDSPRHPYTIALLASTPHVDPARRQHRIVLKGELPSPLAIPPGCAFAARCPHVQERCRQERPELRPVGGRQVACHRAEEIPALAPALP